MAAPNIVNVTTITGITTRKANVGNAAAIHTLVSNASSSNKVIKINNITATGIGETCEITTKIFDQAAGVGSSVSIGTTLSVPVYSSLVVVSKENSFYLAENQSVGVFKTNLNGQLDVTCSYEEIS